MCVCVCVCIHMYVHMYICVETEETKPSYKVLLVSKINS